MLAKNAGSTGENEIAVSQTTGTFIKGEQLVINERTVVAKTINLKDIVAYTVDDIKSVFQDSDGLTLNYYLILVQIQFYMKKHYQDFL